MAKFSELEIGQEWAESGERTPAWQVPWSASRVVIVDTHPYDKNSWKNVYTRASKGTRGMYVKVKVLGWVNPTVDLENARDSYVYAPHLFMKWDEYKVKFDKQKADRDAYNEQQSNRLRHSEQVIRPKVVNMVALMTKILQADNRNRISEYDLKGMISNHNAEKYVDLMIRLLEAELDKSK
ncbi:MAG: hypothetical protein ACK5XN_32925 [Bacteroidota bacterium]|jgi:hypothetical protein